MIITMMAVLIIIILSDDDNSDNVNFFTRMMIMKMSASLTIITDNSMYINIISIESAIKSLSPNK